MVSGHRGPRDQKGASGPPWAEPVETVSLEARKRNKRRRTHVEEGGLGEARVRLDVLLVRHGLAETREKAQALVLAGEVLVGGQPASKPGQAYPADSALEVKRPLPYVSRGGLKLERALDTFGLDPSGIVALDVGASTGGFTDCLLKRGARRVYAVDVGFGQLDWRLRQDERVVVMERTNVRNLESLPEAIDAVVADVSFISLTLALPPAVRLLRAGGWIVALIKPQFEAGKGQVGKGGVVRDPATHRSVLLRVLGWARASGLEPRGLTTSPVRGPAGNVEFLAYLRKPDAASAGAPETTSLAGSGEGPDIEQLVEECLGQVASAIEPG